MNQLTKLISGLSLAQRISVIVLALATVGGVMAFVHWRHESDFHPLYTSMAPEDAATVVQKLRESNVEYRLADNGATVLVPSQKAAESRLTLAQAGLPKSGRIGFELFDKTNFGATEFVEHINYKRALEGELERSVMSLAEVEQARVHLTLPKESIFLDQQQPAKASVMVKLKPGAQISQQNVKAVTNLVASAVEGLLPDAVSLVDMDGNLLNRPRKAGADAEAITSEALEVRQQIERGLVSKINQTLEPLLGNGFRAGVSIDCDLTSGEEQEETLDPSKSVMTTSQKTEEVSEHTTAGGIPGTAANLPGGNNTSAAAKNGVATSKRTENISYQTSRTVRHTHIPQGVIKRMSLAVLVDQGVQWEGFGATARRVLVPPSPETLKTIKDLVAGVTGFNADRGDQLVVDTLPFESSLHSAPPPAHNAPLTATPTTGVPWQDFLNKNRKWWIPAGAVIVVLLVLAIGVLRMRSKAKKRRIAMELARQAEIEAARAAAELPAGEHGELPAGETAQPQPVVLDHNGELVERARVLAKRDPAVTANVLRMWLTESRL